MLNHSQARIIAEAMWGRGGTSSEPTNRTGAFYFSCSGHGGFVIDTRALTDEELVAISEHVDPEEASIYSWRRRQILIHPYRTRSVIVPLIAEREDFKFILLEEDCAWGLAYICTGIRHRNKPAAAEHVQATFERYYV